MTSVPQLPVESASAKALPKGETPRARANKPSEEGGEGGFAAVLAQALPELAQAAKAALGVAPKSLEVEGEGPAREVEMSAVADTGETVDAEKAAAPTVVTLEALPQELSAETATGKGPRLVAMNQTRQDWSVAAALAADVAGEGAAVEELSEARTVEVNDAPRLQAPKPSSETSTQARGPASEGAATKTQLDERTADRPQTHPPTPKHVELRTAPAIPTDPPLATHAAAAQAEQAPHTKSTVPGNQEAPTLRAEVAYEANRLVETPPPANTAPRPADETPAVIEFQVRRESRPQDARQTPETSEWIRAIASKGAALQAAEPALPVAPRTVDEAIEAAATKESKPAPFRSAMTQTIDKTPRGELGQDGAQARRDHSNDRPDARGESLARKAAPESPTAGVNSIPTSHSAEPEASKETSKQGSLKPALAALPTSAPQMTAQASMPAEPPPARPREETRPIASANPPNAPEIAAKLQQQSGRTTLNIVLQDERLGRVALQLVERGGWIETAIRASDPRTAQTLSNGAAGLFEALQQRGLALATGGGASSAWDAQEGQRRDNPQRDQESQGRRFRLRRNAGQFEGALMRAEV